MMQRDHRCQSTVAHTAQHVAIAFERIFIPCIRGWLDATPFHAEAMRILPGFGGAVEIFLPATAPPIGCQTRCPLRMPVLFPQPPLVVRVVTFHLMCGCSGPP